MPAAVTGTCLCGAVRFIINGELRDPLNCHCRMCRKAQGVAFRSRAAVARSAFTLTAGAENLRAYASSPGENRVFCRTCGAPIMTRFDNAPGVLGVPLGGLEGLGEVRPQRHVYTDSRAPWHTIRDALPQVPDGT